MSTHVELSPSSTSRWLACPGSIRLSRGIPERAAGPAALEGTAAHALAEYTLNSKYATATGYLLSQKFGDSDPLWTSEMAEHVQMFVGHCRELEMNSLVWSTEERLSFARVQPPGPMAGTADFIARTDDDLLHIVDLKYGKGVFVQVEDNPQLIYYAIMGLLWCEDNSIELPARVRLTIIQPRIEYWGEVIRSVDYDVDFLFGWMTKLLNGAAHALTPDAELTIGTHCRWCPAIAVCPAQQENATKMAEQEFGDLSKEFVPPPAAALGPAQIGAILTRARALRDWVDALEKEVEAQLKEGKSVPGWKLVEKAARRKWIDDEDTIARTLRAAGLPAEAMYHQSLLGVTDAEKLLKKLNAVLPVELTTKVSSGVSLAPEGDSRPAANVTAESEFSQP